MLTIFLLLNLTFSLFNPLIASRAILPELITFSPNDLYTLDESEFEINGLTNIQLTIFQAQGLEILRRDLTLGSQQMDLTYLTPGAYFLRIENRQTGQSFLKIVVKY